MLHFYAVIIAKLYVYVYIKHYIFFCLTFSSSTIPILFFSSPPCHPSPLPPSHSPFLWECVCLHVLLSCVQLFAAPWTVTHQASLSMGFSRQEYWSGLPFPSPGDLPHPGVEPGSPALQADAWPSELLGKASLGIQYHYFC